MSTQDVRQPGQDRLSKQRLDLPGCIKYILLLFLLLLFFAELYAGEFRRFPDWGTITWIILFIKLLLILLLIWLIWVQRHLNCAITEPYICAIAEYDAVLHKWVVRVKGTASGSVFGNYTLAVYSGGSAYPMPIIYPGGGASGVAPVTNGELGLLDVTDVPSDAYTVILTVNPSGWGSSRSCESDFDILRKTVSITAIGGVTAQVISAHPDDPSEVLKLVKATPNPADPDASVGESISVSGTADYDGCGRQMSEYVLQYKEVAFGSNPWQQDAADPWTVINGPLPFGDAAHPRVYSSFWGQIDNFVRTPNFLTRIWAFRQILQAILPGPTLVYDGKWITEGRAWDTGPASLNLNGRFTVRVRVRHQPLVGPPDPTPPELYDAATVWLDNRPIEGKITGMAVSGGAPLGECDELLMSQFVTPSPLPAPQPGPFSKVNADINGRAWDPVILDSYVQPLPTPHTIRPNNNFGNYTLDYKKDGAVSFLPMATSPNRVPDTLQQSPLAPYPADTGLLHSWDIVGALDAGPIPSPYVPPPYPKIYRSERCAYLIVLQVSDTTSLGDAGSTHYIRHDWPFCIMNDLPDDVPFPVPA